jgi:hypothetical protein
MVVAVATSLALWLAEIGMSQVVSLLMMTGGVLMLALALKRAPGGAGKREDRATEGTNSDSRRHAPEGRAMGATLRDAEELAALVAEQVDRQAARLERLMAEVDERIRKLERLREEPPVPRQAEATDPMNRRIYDLADQGLPPVEIARTLNQQTGKVELVLALRQR